jgi:hypothetical protein
MKDIYAALKYPGDILIYKDEFEECPIEIHKYVQIVQFSAVCLHSCTPVFCVMFIFVRMLITYLAPPIYIPSSSRRSSTSSRKKGPPLETLTGSVSTLGRPSTSAALPRKVILPLPW